MPRAWLKIRIRSGACDCGLVEAAFRWRARAGLGFAILAALAEDRLGRLWVRSRYAFRQIVTQSTESDSQRQSCKRRQREGTAFSGRAAASRKQSRRFEFR